MYYLHQRKKERERARERQENRKEQKKMQTHSLIQSLSWNMIKMKWIRVTLSRRVHHEMDRVSNKHAVDSVSFM